MAKLLDEVQVSKRLAKRRFTANEYERMGEVGIFPPNDRLELLEGGIYEISQSEALTPRALTPLLYFSTKSRGDNSSSVFRVRFG